MKKLFAKTNLNKYQGVYPVKEFLGSIVSLDIPLNEAIGEHRYQESVVKTSRTTDFRINEIRQFCNEDGTNYYHKFD